MNYAASLIVIKGYRRDVQQLHRELTGIFPEPNSAPYNKAKKKIKQIERSMEILLRSTRSQTPHEYSLTQQKSYQSQQSLRSRAKNKALLRDEIGRLSDDLRRLQDRLKATLPVELKFVEAVGDVVDYQDAIENKPNYDMYSDLLVALVSLFVALTRVQNELRDRKK